MLFMKARCKTFYFFVESSFGRGEGGLSKKGEGKEDVMVIVWQ